MLSQHWVKPLGLRDLPLVLHDHGLWSSGKISTRAFQGDKWVAPDVRNRCQGKSYMPLWITNATELLPRIALSVNVSLPIWRSRMTDIPSCPCWQIWLQSCDNLFRWHRFFVMSLMFQYKISVLLIEQFGTKTMVRLIDLSKLLPLLVFR